MFRVVRTFNGPAVTQYPTAQEAIDAAMKFSGERINEYVWVLEEVATVLSQPTPIVTKVDPIKQGFRV